MEKVVFFGTPEFVLPVVRNLKEDKNLRHIVELAGIITGVNSSVKDWALKNGVFNLTPVDLRDEFFLKRLEAINPTLGVIAGYGKIIPQKILDLFDRGVINVHPSLLPRFRGPSPVQTAILLGEKETGVSLMLTDEKVDHGPVLAQKRVPLYGEETALKLSSLLFKLGAELLSENLPAFLRGTVKPKAQDKSQATYTKIIKREDGLVDWRKPCEDILAMLRAYEPWPGIFIFLPKTNKRLKILKAEIKNFDETLPGKISRGQNGEFLIGAKNCCLNILEVQPDGKNRMKGKDFLLGHGELIGQTL